MPSNLGNKHLDKPAPSRPRRLTPRMNKEEISSKCQAGKTYKETIKQIHTVSVQECLEKYKINRVLKRNPPDISPAELNLPRRIRAIQTTVWLRQEVKQLQYYSGKPGFGSMPPRQFPLISMCGKANFVNC